MSNADQSQSTPLLFIQGGGDGAHDDDARLVANLRRELGAGYEVRFPRMPNESETPYDLWSDVIASELARMGTGVILVGHSIGASVLIKWLTEVTPTHPDRGYLQQGEPCLHGRSSAAHCHGTAPISLYGHAADMILPVSMRLLRSLRIQLQPPPPCKLNLLFTACAMVGAPSRS